MSTENKAKLAQSLEDRATRKALYVVGIVVGVLVVGLTIAEVFSPGLAVSIAGAAGLAIEQVKSIIAGISTLVLSVLALRNLTPKDDETSAEEWQL
ncbi:hypothetical protein [Nesterenkonia rhizosphaerae]|uniref:Holin n=1 Tax=Nesterenkonia rhizosphaerae TaxID=1348272 RepID=A0ABP9FSX4_9MICC